MKKRGQNLLEASKNKIDSLGELSDAVADGRHRRKKSKKRSPVYSGLVCNIKSKKRRGKGKKKRILTTHTRLGRGEMGEKAGLEGQSRWSQVLLLCGKPRTTLVKIKKDMESRGQEQWGL